MAKRKLSKKKRSQAAKRGWATRRANQEKLNAQLRIEGDNLKAQNRLLALRNAETLREFEKTQKKARLIYEEIDRLYETRREVFSEEQYTRLVNAEIEGDFDVEAWEMAEELDIAVHEVYEAWFY